MADASATTATLWPRPWYLATFGLATAAGILLLGLVLDGGGAVAAPFGGIGAAAGMAWTVRLRVSDDGLAMMGRSIRWEEAVLQRSRWGESLANPQAERARRMKVFLPTYERDWRSGVVGGHARRHAPHVLSG